MINVVLFDNDQRIGQAVLPCLPSIGSSFTFDLSDDKSAVYVVMGLNWFFKPSEETSAECPRFDFCGWVQVILCTPAQKGISGAIQLARN